MMGFSIEPSESLPPSLMAESNKKEDITVNRSTFASWRKKKGKPEARKQKNEQGSKKTMNNDPKSNVHSIYRGDGLFNNWQELKRCPKISHHNAPPLKDDHYSNTCPLHVRHVCKSTARVLHAPIIANNCYLLSSMHSKIIRKRAELSYLATYLT